MVLNHYGKNSAFKITLEFEFLATPVCLSQDLR